MEMKDRIKLIMESQKMTQQEFADYIKIAPATLSSIFTGRTRPTLSIVEAIKNRFANISTDWLMFGSGPMLTAGTSVSGTLEGDSLSLPSSAEVSVNSVEQQVGGIDWATDTATIASTMREGGVEESANNHFRGSVKMPDNDLSKNTIEIKKCDNRQRKISEIRIFYDDQTWETFLPKEK